MWARGGGEMGLGERGAPGRRALVRSAGDLAWRYVLASGKCLADLADRVEWAEWADRADRVDEIDRASSVPALVLVLIQIQVRSCAASALAVPRQDRVSQLHPVVAAAARQGAGGGVAGRVAARRS